jgi:membrane fusion protein (multidrug efflux system)
MNNKLSIITFFAAFVFWGCSEKKTPSASATAPDSVEVFSLKKETVAKNLSLPAEIHAWERAELYAKVEGYVRELKVDIGDHVKRNDILAILDAPEVMANYAKSVADLQAAQARYKTSLDTYKRFVNASREKGSISASELERTQNQMLSDSATFIAAQSGANAYAQLKNYLVIRAAFDGVITQRNVDPGALVGSNHKPIFVLENLSKLRLRVAIPETYTSATLESTTMAFTVDARPSKTYSAVLSRKSNQIDPLTRTELWEFEVNNSNQELKSGMYGNVNFNLLRGEPSFVIPYSALVTNLERNVVIRIRNKKVELVDIKNGISLKDKLEIFGTLNEGDQLVLKANDEIKEGTRVAAKVN